MKQTTERAALMALLDERNTSLTQAAEAAGISRKTLYNCLHDVRFLEAYKRHNEWLAVQRAEDLAAAREKALCTIISLLDDETQPGPVRLNAAKLILAADAEARARLGSVLHTADFDAKWGELG